GQTPGHVLGGRARAGGIRTVGNPAVPARRAALRGGLVAADPDRQSLLHRRRLERDAVDDVVLASVRDLFARPKPAEKAEAFVEHRCAHLLVRRLAELAELRR